MMGRVTERVDAEAESEPGFEPSSEPGLEPDLQPHSQPDFQPDLQPHSQPDFQPDFPPDSETDARLQRMDRVAILHAEISAATREFLRAVAECDRHEDWAEEGFGSCAEWLAWRIGITRNTANERVRVATALEELPLISEAMGRGELSFSKVRALTRTATPDNEADLLELARHASAARLERIVRSWKELERWDEDENKRERARHRSRTFSVFPDEDGMYVVKGRLSAEVGAALMRAVEAASDALFRGLQSRDTGDDRDDGGDDWGDDGGDDWGDDCGDDCGDDGGKERNAPSRNREDPAPEPAQLRADALGLIAERALASGFGDDAPVSGSRAERYQVMVHVEERTLRKNGAERALSTADKDRAARPSGGLAHPGPPRPRAHSARSELEDGTPVSAETARRLTCDASVVEVRHGTGDPGADGARDPSPDREPDGASSKAASPRPSPDSLARDASGNGSSHRAGHASGRGYGLGPVLDVGRRTRTVPPALRRALEVRDRGCRFPGCGLRFTDAHHIEHWADGGRTALDNLVLLCGRHHRRVHEDGWRVCCDRDGQLVFFTPGGRALGEVPEMPTMDGAPLHRLEPLSPFHRLLRRNRTRGVAPDWRTGMPRWKRDSHLPHEIEAAAWEALDS